MGVASAMTTQPVRVWLPKSVIPAMSMPMARMTAGVPSTTPMTSSAIDFRSSQAGSGWSGRDSSAW